MLQVTDFNTRSAPLAWAARRDAERRNAENRSTYSKQQIERAETLFGLLKLTYEYKRMFLNFRKTMITIKIEEGHVPDKYARDVDLYFEYQGIKKIRTDQGVVYRIPRGK